MTLKELYTPDVMHRKEFVIVHFYRRFVYRRASQTQGYAAPDWMEMVKQGSKRMIDGANEVSSAIITNTICEY